jgi:glycosyltransferase involved in cell wall biosynthesis
MVFKIHIHDFAGHPFQAELSNELAHEGFQVIHSYFKHTGAEKAAFRDIKDSGRIKFSAINFPEGYQNRILRKRLIFEIKLAFSLLKINRDFTPDVLILANTPLITALITKIISRRPAFILWHQDVISRAFLLLIKSKRNNINLLDGLQYKFLEKLERILVKTSDGVICISEAFQEVYVEWNLNLRNVQMIENWAPLSQILKVPHDRDSEDELILLYAGTLGIKHNPSLLIKLMQELAGSHRSCRLIVVSQGEGADFLRARASDQLPIEILDFMPINQLNQLLSTADIALVLLEAEAADFSVPSKAYSYIGAGKFVVAFSPQGNSAMQAINEAGGMVFPPSEAGIQQAIREITILRKEDLALASLLARNYAEVHFDIKLKVEKFMAVIQRALNSEKS